MESVKTLKETVDRQNTKLDSIDKKVFAAEVIISFVGACILIFIGFTAWILDKAWNIFGPIVQSHFHP